MRCTGSTTCALVTTQPRPSTNQPVPVSTNGAGFTVTGPWPQFIVISASTRAVTRATPGLALRIASWIESARAGEAASAAARPITVGASVLMAFDRITEARRFALRSYNGAPMTRERTDSKTDANLLVALAGKADANRRYLAYGIQALNEDRPDIAQLFFEAAGAETIHALNHLRTMGAIATTRENLQTAATGEMLEIEVVLPRMIREAELATEADRIGRLSSIREVVFGAQDGLVSTFAVVAGLAATGVGHTVVLLAG